MVDIVERLRKTEFAFEPPMRCLDLMDEAADEIERLREALRYYEMERNTGSVTATAYHDGEVARSALQQKDSE